MRKYVTSLLLIWSVPKIDLFAFINHTDPTKVRIGEKQNEEGQVSLLESTRGRVVLLADVNEQGKQNDDVQDVKKRKKADGASSSDHPSKKLREDHDTSGDVGASTGEKSLAVIQEFVRVVICATTPVLTAAIATTAIAGATSALAYESRTRPVQRSIFREFASPSAAEADVAGPSQPVDVEVSTDTFFISQEMDSKTLQQTYVPKWNVINNSALDDPEVCQSMVNQLDPPGFFSQPRDMDYEQLFAEFNVGVARQACFSAEIRLRSEHNYMERKKFEKKCNRQTDLLKEKDVEIANLKAQLSLKAAKATEAIRLHSYVSVVEAAETARVGELDSLKERNAALEVDKGTLEGQVAALEFATAAKDNELASFTAHAASLESQKDSLIDQVSLLKATCFGLRDHVSGYELFKEQYEVVQDEQVKVLSDKVAGLDVGLIGMALHLDAECRSQ
ncbi:hypothetical protein Tco_1454341 [Tanacetum coccineum]